QKPAPINWTYYRSVVAKAGMVDEFEKKFAELTVPEPVDTQTAKIDAQEQEAIYILLLLLFSKRHMLSTLLFVKWTQQRNGHFIYMQPYNNTCLSTATLPTTNLSILILQSTFLSANAN
uniref:ATP synthase subunit d, mitochondrial n=1 Tax=Cyprinus carpio TaxID=7962 RepID=A0A8C1LS20_CYPCA